MRPNIFTMTVVDLLKFGIKYAMWVGVAFLVLFTIAGIEHRFLSDSRPLGYYERGSGGIFNAYTKEQAGQGCIYVKC